MYRAEVGHSIAMRLLNEFHDLPLSSDDKEWVKDWAAHFQDRARESYRQLKNGYDTNMSDGFARGIYGVGMRMVAEENAAADRLK
jgi:hypothetical protein